MSYILDALKKSDQDRQRRKPAGLDTMYAAELQTPKRKLHWALIIACALVLNAALMLWWLRPWNRGGTETDNRGTAPGQQLARVAGEVDRKPPAPPREKPGPGGPPNPALREQAKKDRMGRPLPQIPAVSPQTNVDKNGGAGRPPEFARTSPAARPAPRQPAGQLGTPPAADEPQEPLKTPRVLPGPPPGKETKPVPEPPPTGTPSQTADAAPAVKPPPPRHPLPPKHRNLPGRPRTRPPKFPGKKPQPRAAVPDAKTNRQHIASEQSGQIAGNKDLVSDLKALTGSEKPAGKAAGSAPTARVQDLPSSIRGSLPSDFGLDAHLLRKTRDRYININGSRIHEGQEVSGGLKVEEITPDGAVFSYQGYRFYKPVIGD